MTSGERDSRRDRSAQSFRRAFPLASHTAIGTITNPTAAHSTIPAAAPHSAAMVASHLLFPVWRYFDPASTARSKITAPARCGLASCARSTTTGMQMKPIAAIAGRRIRPPSLRISRNTASDPHHSPHRRIGPCNDIQPAEFLGMIQIQPAIGGQRRQPDQRRRFQHRAHRVNPEPAILIQPRVHFQLLRMHQRQARNVIISSGW